MGVLELDTQQTHLPKLNSPITIILAHLCLCLGDLLLLLRLDGGRFEAIHLTAGIVARHVVGGVVSLRLFYEVNEGKSTLADLPYWWGRDERKGFGGEGGEIEG